MRDCCLLVDIIGSDEQVRVYSKQRRDSLLFVACVLTDYISGNQSRYLLPMYEVGHSGALFSFNTHLLRCQFIAGGRMFGLL